MKKVSTTVLTVVFALFFLASVSAFAQTTSIESDDRYSAWEKASRVKVVWPTELPDLTKCAAQEPYEPHFVNLFRFVPAGIKFRVQPTNECTWTLAGKQWLWKIRPKGTKVAVDSQGRDMFDLGPEDGNGKVCGNPRVVSIPIIPPPPAAPAPPPRVEPPPPPVEVPAPPPAEVVSIPPQTECEIRPSAATAKFGDSVTFEGYIRGDADGAAGKWSRDDWEEIGQGGSITVKAEKNTSIAFRVTDSMGRRTVCRGSLTVVQSPPPEEEIVITKKRHKVPIPCFPREKSLYGIGLPILECAAIVGGAWWLWPSAPALFKTAACVAFTGANGVPVPCP